MTTEDVIERFAREYQDYNQISKERAKQQVKLLHEFASTLNGRSVVEADGGDLAAFAGQLQVGGLHVNTVRKKLNMIRPFYSWAYARKLVTGEQYLDLKGVKNPRGATGKTTPNPYRKGEVQAFWVARRERLPALPEKGNGSQALKRWIRGIGPWRKVARHAMGLQIDAMVRLALDCGLRRAEIYGLSLDDMHYDNEYIVVKGKADPNTGLPKNREVPFTAAAREAVKAWVEFRAIMRPQHTSPWLSCYGPDTFNHAMGWDRFKTLLQSTVGPEWRWHRFRHTCATEWLRAGAHIETVQPLLGHASISQTLAYAEILKSDIARDLGKFEANFERAVRDDNAGAQRAA